MVLSIAFLVMFMRDEVVWRALAMGVFGVAAVTDFFDGYIARHYGAQSESGVFLDPLADKVLTFAGFLSLVLIWPGLFPWWGLAAIIARDIFVTLLRVRADKVGFTMETRYSAKVKTFAQMVFLYISLLAAVFLNTEASLAPTSQWLFSGNILTISYFTVAAITRYTGIEYAFVNRGLVSGKGHEEA